MNVTEALKDVILFVIAAVFVFILITLILKYSSYATGYFFYAMSVLRERAADIVGKIKETASSALKKAFWGMVGTAAFFFFLKIATKATNPVDFLIRLGIVAGLTATYAYLARIFVFDPLMRNIEMFTQGLQDVTLTVFEMFNPEYYKYLINARTSDQIITYLKFYILRGAFEGNIWDNFKVISIQKFTNVNLTGLNEKLNDTMLSFNKGLLFFSTNCSLTENESGYITYYYVPPWYNVSLNIIENYPNYLKNAFVYEYTSDMDSIFMFPLGYIGCGKYIILLMYPLSSSPSNPVEYITFGIDTENGKYNLFKISVNVLEDNSTVSLGNLTINDIYIYERNNGWSLLSESCDEMYPFFETSEFKVFYPGILTIDYYGSDVIKQSFKEKLGLNSGVIMEVLCYQKS